MTCIAVLESSAGWNPQWDTDIHIHNNSHIISNHYHTLSTNETYANMFVYSYA